MTDPDRDEEAPQEPEDDIMCSDCSGSGVGRDEEPCTSCGGGGALAADDARYDHQEEQWDAEREAYEDRWKD